MVKNVIYQPNTDKTFKVCDSAGPKCDLMPPSGRKNIETNEYPSLFSETTDIH